MSVEPTEAAAHAESVQWRAAAESAAPAGEDENLADRASAAVAAAQDAARHFAELLAAETRLAALSGVSIVLMVIVAAALSIVGWAFVAAVATYLLVMLGLPWPAAGLLMAGVHALAAYLLWRGIVRLSANLTLPAVRRAVTGSAEQ
ncbi:MAG: hypothetical protein JXB36_10815 [Gammaproteobacteria bacterium]|nr:hypothetical protein [Gammaproteobacteria bacterium]